MSDAPALPIAVEAGTRLVIDGYGGGGFRIAGVLYPGSLMIHAGAALAWLVADFAAIDDNALAPLLADARPEIMLLGCGPRMALPGEGLRAACREAGAVLETMDTGAACRTYNVLVGEDRHVAAALIALP